MQHNVGIQFSMGAGCQHSYAQAIKWLTASAKQGWVDSTHALAAIRHALPPLFGKRVVLLGLNTESLNGVCGRVVDFSYPGCLYQGSLLRDDGRYTVRLDGAASGVFKVKAVNAQIEMGELHHKWLDARKADLRLQLREDISASQLLQDKFTALAQQREVAERPDLQERIASLRDRFADLQERIASSREAMAKLERADLQERGLAERERGLAGRLAELERVAEL